MTRRKAAAMTAAVCAGSCALAWAAERWPNATLVGVSLATIYTGFRASDEKEGQPDGDGH